MLCQSAISAKGKIEQLFFIYATFKINVHSKKSLIRNKIAFEPKRFICMHTHVTCAWLRICAMCLWVTEETAESIAFPGAGATGRCELPAPGAAS